MWVHTDCVYWLLVGLPLCPAALCRQSRVNKPIHNNMWRAGLGRHRPAAANPGTLCWDHGERSFVANRKCRNGNKKLCATNQEKELHLTVKITLVCDAQDEVTSLSREGWNMLHCFWYKCAGPGPAPALSSNLSDDWNSCWEIVKTWRPVYEALLIFPDS